MKTQIRILIVATTLVFTQLSIAQTGFERWYGDTADDGAFDVIETSDNGFALTGYYRSAPGALDDVWLIKTDAAGDVMWTQTYGGADYDDGKSVRQTADGGYIIGGWTQSSGAGERDILLIKTDATGNVEWEKTYGGTDNDEAEAVRQTTDGGYIVAATSAMDILLLKTDANGTIVWQKIFRKSVVFDMAGSVLQASDGGYVVVGGGSHVWLFKTDADGNMLWEQVFQAPAGVGTGRSVGATSDGGYIVAGWVAVGLWDHEVFMAKTDADGNVAWTNMIGDLDSIEDGESVQQTSDGGYIIGGTRDYGISSQQDVYLVKTDASGDSLWTRTFGGSNAFDEGYAVLQARDGAYVVGGHTGSFGNNGDAYLIKTGGGSVGIAEEGRPSRFESDSYPSPFTESVRITYVLPQPLTVELAVYDVLGRKVATPVSEVQSAGQHTVTWSANGLPDGLYVYRLRAGAHSEARAMLLAR